MKQRVITTRKILVATVFAGAAGCSRPASEITPATAASLETSPPARTAPAAVDAPEPPAAPSDPLPAEAAQQASPPPIAEAAIDEARLRLRSELESVTVEQAVARLSHFRPLCDDKGFPLVGNVMRKAPIETQPSELCGVVRARFIR